MKNLTDAMKINGEIVVRTMSAKAQQGYRDTDPLVVYENDGVFFIKDFDGQTDDMTREEVEEYLESLVIEDEEDGKTYADYMEDHPTENMSWCKPFSTEDDHYLVRNENNITLVYPDGREISDPTNYDLKIFAQEVNPDYDLYDGWDDSHIAVDAMKEVGCVDCPFFKNCDCMTDEM